MIGSHHVIVTLLDILQQQDQLPGPCSPSVLEVLARLDTHQMHIKPDIFRVSDIRVLPAGPKRR